MFENAVIYNSVVKCNMHSIVWTGRILSRALWNSITNYSNNCADPKFRQKREPHILSAVCGFPKDFKHAKLRKGQFGDDAWFFSKSKTADVFGKYKSIFPEDQKLFLSFYKA